MKSESICVKGYKFNYVVSHVQSSLDTASSLDYGLISLINWS